jgi:LemA protein
MMLPSGTLVATALVVMVAAGLSGCSYNKFTTQEEAIKSAWAEVQNQIQRRSDLIPNLVETVKGYATHEETVFKEIADARSQLLAAKSPAETMAAANQQASALGRLLAVVESYPNLKANEQFNRLMDSLEGTENRLTVARKRYNDALQDYNTSRRKFPGNVTAKMFNFKDYPYFEAPPAALPPNSSKDFRSSSLNTSWPPRNQSNPPAVPTVPRWFRKSSTPPTRYSMGK